jgi:hypothetical protein
LERLGPSIISLAQLGRGKVQTNTTAQRKFVLEIAICVGTLSVHMLVLVLLVHLMMLVHPPWILIVEALVIMPAIAKAISAAVAMQPVVVVLVDAN